MTEFPQSAPEEVRRASELADGWHKLRHKIESEKKDEIGSLYMKHILGLDEQVVGRFKSSLTRFVGGEHEAYHAVGAAQSGFRAKPEAIKRFWTRVRETESRLVPTEEQLQFVVEKGGDTGAFQLIWELAESTVTPSLLLSRLLANAHVYK